MSATVLTPAPTVRPRVARTHPARWRGPVAAGAGLLLAAAFPPLSAALLAPIAVAGLTLACRGGRVRGGAWCGLLFGLAFFLPLLHWSATYVGAPPWLMLSGSQAVFLAGLGAGLVLVTRLRWWPLWAAALWVAAEAARDRLPFGGFPWGRLAFSQSGTPYAAFASLGGAPLVTFTVALTGTLLAASATAGGRRRLGLGVAALLVVVSGLLLPLPTAGEGAGGPAYANVAIIQGNVPRLGLDAFDQQRAVLRLHVEETLRLAARVAAGLTPRPDLVVWPENSSDLDPYQDAAAARLIETAVRAIGVPVLVGAVLDAGPTRIRNTGIVWDPYTGPGAVYDKRHPVPFAEYIPYRPLARRVSAKVDLVQRDFLAGHRPGVLQVGPARIGDVICFEVAYDGLVRDVVRGGGRLLVVQTNNATFGRSAETSQQLAMSRIRAIEHGRTVLISSTSGISAVIRPDGRVSASTRIFNPATLLARVPLRDRRTVADRVGAGPEELLTLAGLGAVLAAAAAALRARRREATTS